jgi:hypothetical protein
MQDRQQLFRYLVVLQSDERGGVGRHVYHSRLARYRETWRWSVRVVSDSRVTPHADARARDQSTQLFVAYPGSFFSRRYKTASSGSYFLFPEHLAKALIRFRARRRNRCKLLSSSTNRVEDPMPHLAPRNSGKCLSAVMAVGGVASRGCERL